MASFRDFLSEALKTTRVSIFCCTPDSTVDFGNDFGESQRVSSFKNDEKQRDEQNDVYVTDDEFGQAAKTGDIATVERYLAERGNFTLVFHGEGTAMEIAYANDHYEVVQVLGIRAMSLSNLQKVSFYGEHAFLLASYNGDQEFVEYLLRIDGNDIARTVKDRDGSCALHLAAQRGSPSLLKLLIDAGAFQVPPVDRNQFTPITFAATAGNLNGLEFLLSHFQVNEGCMEDSLMVELLQPQDEIWARRPGKGGYWRATLVSTGQPEGSPVGSQTKSGSTTSLDDTASEAKHHRRPSAKSMPKGPQVPNGKVKFVHDVRYTVDFKRGKAISRSFIRKAPPYQCGDRVDFITGLRCHKYFSPGFVEEVHPDGQVTVYNPNSQFSATMVICSDLIRPRQMDATGFKTACELGYSRPAIKWLQTQGVKVEDRSPIDAACSKGDPEFFIASAISHFGHDLRTRDGRQAFWRQLIVYRSINLSSLKTVSGQNDFKSSLSKEIPRALLNTQELHYFSLQTFLHLGSFLPYETCKSRGLLVSGEAIDPEGEVLVLLVGSEEPSEDQYHLALEFLSSQQRQQGGRKSFDYVWVRYSCVSSPKTALHSYPLALVQSGVCVVIPQTLVVTQDLLSEQLIFGSESAVSFLLGKQVSDLVSALKCGMDILTLVACLATGSEVLIGYQFGLIGSCCFLPLDDSSTQSHGFMLKKCRWLISDVSEKCVKSMSASFTKTASSPESDISLIKKFLRKNWTGDVEPIVILAEITEKVLASIQSSSKSKEEESFASDVMPQQSQPIEEKAFKDALDLILWKENIAENDSWVYFSTAKALRPIHNKGAEDGDYASFLSTVVFLVIILLGKETSLE